MGDGSLSQKEIDALLMGADDADSVDLTAQPGDSMGMGMGMGMGMPSSAGMSSADQAILTDSFREAMEVAGNQTSALIGTTISFTNPISEEIPTENLKNEIISGSVIITVSMGSTASFLVFPNDLAKSISMIMMGEGSKPVELNDGHLSTLSELSNTIISSLSNSLASKFNDNLNPSPPEIKIFSTPNDLPVISSSNLYKATYDVVVEGESPSKVYHYIDSKSASAWAKNMTDKSSINTPAAATFTPPAKEPASEIPINPVNFPSLQQAQSETSTLPPNFQLLLDVQMVMTVELGRTRKYVKDILALGEGSIIELDKLAGEPVDLLVNGKLIAKGEVVVIDENFGVRVTDIVGPAERLARLTADN